MRRQPDINKKAFGARVAMRRRAIGWTAEQLANQIGMRQQGISSIEQGVTARPRLIRELASALRTTPEWLWWERGPEEIAAPKPMDAVAPAFTPETVYEVLVETFGYLGVSDPAKLAGNVILTLQGKLPTASLRKARAEFLRSAVDSATHPPTRAPAGTKRKSHRA